MNSILAYLVKSSVRTTHRYTMEKKIGAGSKWVFPCYFTKGVPYMIEAAGGKKAKEISCTLCDGCKTVNPQQVYGHNSFSFLPEHDGVYDISVVLESTKDSAESEKVKVKLGQEYVPPWYETRQYC